MQLRIFKNQFIKSLATDISKNTSEYLSGDFQSTLDPENGHNYFMVEAPWFDEKVLKTLNGVAGGKKDDVDDVRDTRLLYSSMKGMPPALARDARVWATLTHTHCLSYVRDRNWKFLSGVSPIEIQKNIKSRFFIENIRSFERTNALARLWWFGHIAESTGLPFDEAVDVLLAYTDFRAATVERPEVFVHREIRAAVVDLAIAKKKEGDEFFRNRDRYRPLFTAVTERAARVFFPTMEHKAVVQSLRDALPPPTDSKTSSQKP